MFATPSAASFHVRLLAGAALAVGGIAPATAEALTCGEVVTQSVTLTANLTCPRASMAS